MALFIHGMTCRLCGRPMSGSDQTISFQPFVMNLNDPLLLFHDATFHRACFEAHPLAAAATARHDFVLEQGQRKTCCGCCQRVTSPDDCFTTGFLWDDPDEPLYQLNCTLLHRKCARRWKELDTVLAAVETGIRSGRFRGRGPDMLLEELRAIRHERESAANQR